MPRPFEDRNPDNCAYCLVNWRDITTFECWNEEREHEDIQCSQMQHGGWILEDSPIRLVMAEGYDVNDGWTGIRVIPKMPVHKMEVLCRARDI